MARLRILVPAMVAIGLAVGCGSEQGTPGVNGDLVNTATGSETTPGQQYQAPGTGAPATSDAAAAALIKDVQAAFVALKGYSANLEAVDVNAETGKKVTSKANVKFGKPDMVRVELTMNSDDPKKAGTKAVWRGGDTIKVQPSGLLGFAKVDLSTGDPRLLTENKWKINQFSLKTNVETLTSPASKVKYIGRSQLGSYTLALADVYGPLKVTKCDHVKMGIDINTKLPVYCEFLKGTKLLYSMRLMNLKMGTSTAKDFEL